MSSRVELMGFKMPWGLAGQLGSHVQTAVTAAGTAITDATACTGAFIEVATAGSNSGIQLPDGSSVYVVYNGGANAVKVYPPTSSYMNGTQNAAFSVTNAKSAIFFRADARFIGVLSA
jgi:hypothetical protein